MDNFRHNFNLTESGCPGKTNTPSHWYMFCTDIYIPHIFLRLSFCINLKDKFFCILIRYLLNQFFQENSQKRKNCNFMLLNMFSRIQGIFHTSKPFYFVNWLFSGYSIHLHTDPDIHFKSSKIQNRITDKPVMRGIDCIFLNTVDKFTLENVLGKNSQQGNLKCIFLEIVLGNFSIEDKLKVKRKMNNLRGMLDRYFLGNHCCLKMNLDFHWWWKYWHILQDITPGTDPLELKEISLILCTMYKSNLAFSTFCN